MELRADVHVAVMLERMAAMKLQPELIKKPALVAHAK